MIPFLSSADVLLAAGVVSGLSGLASAIYLLARRQRPAQAQVHAAPAAAPAQASAESKVPAAA